MREILTQVFGYLRAIWRYRWYALVIAWVLSIGGWVFVSKLPDQYSSTARVFLDTRSILQPLLRGLAINSGVQDQVALMSKTLLSRPNVEKIARMTDLDLTAKTPEAMNALVANLKGRISIQSARRENLFTISFEDQDPQLAKRVVQSLLTVFMEESLGTSRKDSDVAQRFLDKQIEEYEQRLVESEERLKDFKQKNVELMPSRGGGYYTRLQDTTAELSKAKLALKEAENRRNQLRIQLEDAEELTAETVVPKDMSYVTSQIDARVAKLESQLDSLLLNYTEKHPDVVSIRNTLENLKAQRAEELAAVTANMEAVETKTNPLVQQFRLTLAEAEAVVSSLNVRVQEYSTRVRELKKLVDTVPEVEAELTRLNRDYAVVKENYDELIARRESAKLSQKAEQTGDSVKFRIVDPPAVPTEPSGPNRVLFTSIVPLGGIGIGFAIAVLIYLIRPTFDDQFSLKNDTGLPVLGTVSMVWSEGQKLKRRMEVLVFSVALIGLGAAYGGVMVFGLAESDMVVRVSELLGRFI